MSAAGGLLAEVRSLLALGAEAYTGTAAETRLRRAAERLDEPLRVAVAGKVKAGKSTLLNALLAEELAPTDAGECTRLVTWYVHGQTYRATVHLAAGTEWVAPFQRDAGFVEVDLGGHGVDDVDHVVVECPSARLQDLTLIDTPGIASLTPATSGRALSFLTPSDEAEETPADAVLYLLRHVHEADVALLEAFHDDDLAQPTPVNAIGILSRADEVGAGRLDAMQSARSIAARYRSDPRLRRLCQTVVPVAGLVAEAGATLTEEEFRALARVAEASRAERDALTLSADRFGNAATSIDLTPIDRAHLLARFGLFGIRLSAGLIRHGAAPTAGRLADELSQRSGLDELRRVLQSQFAARAELLKARSALAALAALLRHAPVTGAERLVAQVEQVHAGAHVLAEMRMLHQLRSGAVDLDGDAADAERLLGAEDATVTGRLGLHADASDEEIESALLACLDRWQRRAEHPLSPQPVVDAARVLVRTTEGLIADTRAGPPPEPDPPFRRQPVSDSETG